MKKWCLLILFILMLPLLARAEYAGDTLIINCSEGGLNATKNVDSLPPTAMIHPSRNINYHEGGRRKRGGSSHVNATQFSGNYKVTSIYDYTLINGNQFIITTTANGEVYKDSSTTIKTGMSKTNPFSFETFGNKLFIADGETIPQVWNGSDTETSDINYPAADWTGSNYPTQFLKHGYGNSERMWAIGAANNPNSLYVSRNGYPQDFSNANGLVINIETQDGFGIVGMAEFGGRLFCFGRNNTYYIEDTDTDSSAWGPIKAQWSGGVAHRRLIITTPNDIACMTQDGEVYAISAVQSYGDYKTVSLTRPAFINRWIMDNVQLTSINDFHGIYDPTLRAIKIFVLRKGQTEIDTALVYFLDRPAEEAWVIHGNWTNDSGYSSYTSAIVRESDGNYRMYTGGYDGWTWKLEDVTRSDNGLGYWAGFRLVVNTDNLRKHKQYDLGFVLGVEEGDKSLTIDWWVDGVAKTQRTVSLLGSGFVLGTSKLGTGTLGFKRPLSIAYQLKARGKRLEVEIYNETAGQDFFINKLFIDYRMQGAEPS